MSVRQLMNRLYYFTIEDESILPEAFERFDRKVVAITYKVSGTEDVFVTTHDTKQEMDRMDVPYTLLASEESTNISLLHSTLSREELAECTDALKALALAYQSVAMVCVGVNGDVDLSFDLSDGTYQYTYFTAPSGHTFIWRVFSERDQLLDFITKHTARDPDSMDWAESIPLGSSTELVDYH